MNKTKSIRIFINDFKEIYNTILNLALGDGIRDALFFNSKENINDTEIGIFNQLTQFSKQNLINNYLLINLISITESYLQNILFEELKREPKLYNVFLLNYKFEKNITANDLIEGPQKFVFEILDNIIYHNLPKVNSIFKIITKIDILNIEDIDTKMIFKIVKLRHKIVHGSSIINGKKIIISEVTLLGYMNLISRWLICIDNKITGAKTRRVDYQLKFYKKISALFKTPLLVDGHKYSAAKSVEILDIFFDKKVNDKYVKL